MKHIASALLFIVAAAYVITVPTDAVSCDYVNFCLAPCNFHLTKEPHLELTKALDAPNPSCCLGMAQLLEASNKDAIERQTVCQCAKQVIAKIPGLNDNAAANLPTACGTALPFSISLNVDCNSLS